MTTRLCHVRVGDHQQMQAEAGPFAKSVLLVQRQMRGLQRKAEHFLCNLSI